MWDTRLCCAQLKRNLRQMSVTEALGCLQLTDRNCTPAKITVMATGDSEADEHLAANHIVIKRPKALRCLNELQMHSELKPPPRAM